MIIDRSPVQVTLLNVILQLISVALLAGCYGAPKLLKKKLYGKIP